MSVPNVVKGQYTDVAVFSPPSVTPPVILCGLTTRNLTHQFTTSDEFIRDCSDPTMVPFRVINVTGEQFDISGTGLFNRGQAALLRSIAGQSLKYRFLLSEPVGDPVDAGYYEGNFVASNIQYGSADGANVTIQLTFVSDGQILWVPTAGETVLTALGLTPMTVVHAVAYSGSISGATPGSTITATSSDSTVLTVSGTGATRTVAGTFAAAGVPTITLTETLAAATNTPKVTTKVITVT